MKQKIEGELFFKRLEEKDLSMLFRWFQEQHVSEWWPVSADYKDFYDLFYDKIHHGGTEPFLVFWNGEPIGYIQYYFVDTTENTWLPRMTGTVLGIDQFIGRIDYLHKGLGRLFIREFIKDLVDLYGSHITIIVDPDESNAAAIKCYTNVGFNPVGVYQSPWGFALLMSYKE